MKEKAKQKELYMENQQTNGLQKGPLMLLLLLVALLLKTKTETEVLLLLLLWLLRGKGPP